MDLAFAAIVVAGTVLIFVLRVIIFGTMNSVRGR
jgi:hypothetical protein